MRLRDPRSSRLSHSAQLSSLRDARPLNLRTGRSHHRLFACRTTHRTGAFRPRRWRPRHDLSRPRPIRVGPPSAASPHLGLSVSNPSDNIPPRFIRRLPGQLLQSSSGSIRRRRRMRRSVRIPRLRRRCTPARAPKQASRTRVPRRRLRNPPRGPTRVPAASLPEDISGELF
jgi:hypothetical protein